MFSERLKEARKKKNLLQKELATLLGVSRTTVTSWENGTRVPEFETLRRIADVLEVSVDYLLGRTDDPSPKPLEQKTEKEDPLTDLLKRFEKRNPDTLTVEEALDLILRSDHVMFNGKPIGKMDEDILLDIRDTVVAVLKILVSKKAVVGVKGVASSCLAAAAGAG
ncbi:MAG: helix-turn-helix domain-containing protein [Desulfofundulus sp.]